MSEFKTTCDNCSATIRYADRHASTLVKSPRCKTEIAIPADEDEIVLGGEEDQPVRLAEAPSNFCVDCGKKVNEGVRRCKQCRQNANAQLASRMKAESSYDNAMAAQAQYAGKRHRVSPAWKALHVLLMILTFGVYAPVYYFWIFQPDDDDD